MCRFLISILAIMSLGLFYQTHAQKNIDMVDILNIEQDVASLEARITSLIKKQPKIADTQGLRQYHILWLGYDYTKVESKKEDYLDRPFLYYIDDGYLHINPKFISGKKKKYLNTYTLITDSIGTMVNVLHIEQDIASLEARITSLIKKQPEITDIQRLRQFYILLFSYNNTKVDIKKEDYFDRSFLQQLSPFYYHIKSKFILGKKKKYLDTSTLITDSIGNLVATADARMVYITHANDPEYIKLAKMFFNKEIDFVCGLASPHSMRYMVGIKNNDLYIFDLQDDLKIYPWKEFINCCFDEWVR